MRSSKFGLNVAIPFDCRILRGTGRMPTHSDVGRYRLPFIQPVIWTGSMSRVRHGFVNLRGWAGTGRAGTGMGRAEVTHPKPIPVPRVWWVWFRRDNEGITLFATSKWEWSRGREGLGVETGVNEGDRAPGIEMEGIPLLL